MGSLFRGVVAFVAARQPNETENWSRGLHGMDALSGLVYAGWYG